MTPLSPLGARALSKSTLRLRQASFFERLKTTRDRPRPVLSRFLLAVCTCLFAALVMVISLPSHGAAGPLEQASIAEQRGDYATALHLYRQESDRGCPEASRQIGAMYLMGNGVQQSNSEGLKWYLLAARRGDAIAQQFLGATYQDGNILPQNFAEGEKWLLLAAKQGQEVAQLRLANMYVLAQGVDKNYFAAYFWASLAIANLNGPLARLRARAMALRDEVSQLMTPEQVAHAQRMAAEFSPIKQSNGCEGVLR